MTARGEADLRVPERARLSEMFEAHYRVIWRSLRRLGVPSAQVDDAAQEVFVVATRRIADITVGSERSFLFGVAMRVAKDVRRSAARRKETADDDAICAAEDPRPPTDELTEQKRARDRLDRALDHLSLEHRAVFVLFELEELTLSEIAETLSIPRGTVASRLRRARTVFCAITGEVNA